jgi:hypothetical protein
MHFGLYLQKKGLITSEQFVAALEAQLNTMVPIGQLALEEGVLSARDIFDVLQAQSDSPSELFGQLAVELGMMSREDLMRLLMVQADRKRPLAAILVEQGALSDADMARELAEYRRAQLRPRQMTNLAKPFPARHYDERAYFTSDELITV